MVRHEERTIGALHEIVFEGVPPYQGRRVDVGIVDAATGLGEQCAADLVGNCRAPFFEEVEGRFRGLVGRRERSDEHLGGVDDGFDLRITGRECLH